MTFCHNFQFLSRIFKIKMFTCPQFFWLWTQTWTDFKFLKGYNYWNHDLINMINTHYCHLSIFAQPFFSRSNYIHRKNATLQFSQFFGFGLIKDTRQYNVWARVACQSTFKSTLSMKKAECIPFTETSWYSYWILCKWIFMFKYFYVPCLLIHVWSQQYNSWFSNDKLIIRLKTCSFLVSLLSY